MAKRIQIPRKIEHDPIIYGLVPKYFYIMFLVVVLLGMVLALTIVVYAKDAELSAIGNIFLVFVFELIIFIVLYRYFRSKSIFKKHQFKKKKVYISNRDLYDYL